MMYGFSTDSKDIEEHPIEFISHVMVGNNPDTEHGGWEKQHEAVWYFAKHMEEVLKDAQGKFLFVRRSPVLECRHSFAWDKPIWSMIGRFSIGQLKEKAR